MSDAARLARVSFAAKPNGVSYDKFSISGGNLRDICDKIDDAIISSAYSSAVSYSEAIRSLSDGWVSWSIIRLYYSCFYSMKALLLLNGVIPFNFSKEMLLDVATGTFEKGGGSSHDWNWMAFKKIPSTKSEWFCAQDSQDAYQKLKKHRDNVNYTHGFTDPELHECLVTGEADISKRFRAYRDDSEFFYTYLDDHLSIAYPTKLLFHLDSVIGQRGLTLPKEKVDHIRRIWKIKDRCPIT